MSRERNGAAGLGQLRHRALVTERRLYRSPELWHGGDRSRARSQGSRGHHLQPTERRTLQGPPGRPICSGADGGQHGFHDQPLRRPTARSAATTPTPRRDGWQAARPRRHRLQPALPRGLQDDAPSCWAAWKAACAASPTTTTGATRCAARWWWTQSATCCSGGNAERALVEVAHRLARRQAIERSPTCAARPSSAARATPAPKAGWRLIRPRVDQPGKVEAHISPYQTTSEQAASQGAACARPEMSENRSCDGACSTGVQAKGKNQGLKTAAVHAQSGAGEPKGPGA